MTRILVSPTVPKLSISSVEKLAMKCDTIVIFYEDKFCLSQLFAK